jgi:PIN domain nuclease of toxin-antitoxin system
VRLLLDTHVVLWWLEGYTIVTRDERFRKFGVPVLEA